jgi:hypothetical protein
VWIIDRAVTPFSYVSLLVVFGTTAREMPGFLDISANKLDDINSVEVDS